MSAASPTENLFTALERVRQEAEPGRRAWEVIVHHLDSPDLSAALDFAQEHGLVLPCEGTTTSTHLTWTNPIDGSEMVWIPGGPFVVGEKNQPATCAGFSLARYPVTNGQFERFLASGYEPNPGGQDPEDYLAHWAPGGSFHADGERHPVIHVSYIDALAYCRWAGLILPSQWLWEKAARGPEGRRYPWGDQAPIRTIRYRPLKRESLANVHSSGTLPVGSFPRTRTVYGCEDMIGNVSEWCHPGIPDEPDRFPPWPEIRPEANGGGPYAVVRGSCYLRTTSVRMAAWHTRRLSVIRRNQWVGFRPALFLPYRPALSK